MVASQLPAEKLFQTKNRAVRLKNIVVGLGLLALSGWLDWRLLDGTLSYYLHPRFNLAVAVTGLVLAFLGGWTVWRQVGRATPRQIVSLKIAVPVALFAAAALLTAPHPLNNTGGKSESLAGNQTLTAALQKQDWNNSGKPDTQGWNLLDWSAALNNPQRAAQLAGERLDVTGFVIQPANRNGRSFMLARYVVVCCTADSTALKLPVETTRNTDLENGQWVRVQGVVARDANGSTWFSATTLEPIAQPAQPYLYP